MNLANGAKALKWAPIGSGRRVVLATYQGQFVTWIAEFDRESGWECYWGHYLGDDLRRALKDFDERVGLRV